MSTFKRPSEYTMVNLLPELRDWLEDMADGAPDAHPRARQANEFLEKLDAATIQLFNGAPVAEEHNLERELAILFNRYSLDAKYDTADFLLARYVVDCLANRRSAKA